MSKIKLLPQSEILKIAAGEVVRRPASVVKELVENALDAKASFVIIKILRAGSELIEIIDDGCGMDLEDAKLAVLPHATSKITSLFDLNTIATFGFRGEALASIACVSDLEIKTEHSGTATRLFYKTGVLTAEEALVPAGQNGTTISVHNMFYNVPVRKKFLKSSETEINQIRNVFCALALVHKNITFKLFEDKKIVFNALATDNLSDRVAQLFDYHLAQNMLPLNFEGNEVKLRGLISNLQVTRYNKSGMWLFVNNRFFNDNKLTNALVTGYEGALQAGRFPSVILMIELAPELVDVNVHPAKEEVVFINYGKLLSACKEAVHNALNQSGNKNVQSTVEHENNFNEPVSNPSISMFLSKEKTLPSTFSFGLNEYHPLPEITSNVFEPQLLKKQEEGMVVSEASGKVAMTQSLPDEVFAEKVISSGSLLQEQITILGQVFSTYIVYQKGEVLGFVDQHAASERILYEEIKNNFEKLPKIYLVFPIICDLEQEVSVRKILTNLDLFASFGIEFSQIGRTSLSVVSLPPNFETEDLKQFFLKSVEILEFDNDSTLLRKQAFEHLHSHLACKTAIKAGDRLSLLAMESLVSKLGDVDNRYQCIHGRPTTFEILKTEIAKKFRR